MGTDDWEPPPGMAKLKCKSCGNYFATPGRTSICPGCQVPSIRKAAFRRDTSPFDSMGSSGHRVGAKPAGRGPRSS